MKYLKQFLRTKKSEWDNKIHATFRQYNDFMKSNIQKYSSIVYVDGEYDKAVTYDSCIDLKTRILYVNIELLLKSDNKKIGSVLYHEFTHLYDYDKHVENGGKISKGFLWYAEYHATQIECIKKYSLIKSINKKIDICSSGFIELINEFKMKSIDYSKKLDLLINGGNEYNIEVSYLYCIGIKDLIEKHLCIDEGFSYMNENQKNAHNILKRTVYNSFPEMYFFKELDCAVR